MLISNANDYPVLDIICGVMGLNSQTQFLYIFIPHLMCSGIVLVLCIYI